jgi:hypothetical protein
VKGEMQIDDIKIWKDQTEKSVAMLLVWLESWKTKCGAYNGYVVHRLNLKRMLLVHDTPWSQAPMINSFINLFQRTGNRDWLEKAIEAGSLQAKRITSSGKYNYAGHEDDRFSSLVHNALANCALLDLAKVLLEEDSSSDASVAQAFAKVVRLNTRYLTEKLWVKDKGVFKVSENDYYSPKRDRFVANMNSVAAENLIKLGELTGEKEYDRLAEHIGQWLLSLQLHSSNELIDGAIAYQDNEPSAFVAIYTALALRGVDDLFQLTEDSRYFKMMSAATKHLLSFRDSKYRLFYHAFQGNRLRKFPLFVAGAGIILKALDDFSKLSGRVLDVTDTLNTILHMQLPNGGFSNFVGYNTPDNGRRNGDYSIVWEDVVPTVGWNAHLLEYLTRFVDNDFYLPKELRVMTTLSESKNHFYLETAHSTLILGWNPFQSMIFYLLPNKTSFQGFPIVDVRALAKSLYDLKSVSARELKPALPYQSYGQNHR